MNHGKTLIASNNTLSDKGLNIPLLFLADWKKMSTNTHTNTTQCRIQVWWIPFIFKPSALIEPKGLLSCWLRLWHRSRAYNFVNTFFFIEWLGDFLVRCVCMCAFCFFFFIVNAKHVWATGLHLTSACKWAHVGATTPNMNNEAFELLVNS